MPPPTIEKQLTAAHQSVRHSRWRSAYAGVAAASAGVGTAEIVAAILSPRASPIAATGALIIDLSPPWLKETVIGLFGTADKVLIIVVVALAVVILAALSGVIETKAAPWGRVMIAAVGGIGLFAATTRADSTMLSGLPSSVVKDRHPRQSSVRLRRAPSWWPVSRRHSTSEFRVFT